MKKLLLLVTMLLGFSTALAQSTEYLRPTADINSTFDEGCSGTNAGSGSEGVVYTGKVGIGPSGSAGSMNSGSNTTYEARIFETWQSTTHSYSALTLNVSVSGAVSPYSGVYYSTDGGSTWTSIGATTGSQTTYSKTITGTSLSSIEVYACVGDAAGYVANLALYDIWTTGTYNLLYQPGVQVIGEADSIPTKVLQKDVDEAVAEVNSSLINKGIL